MCLQVLVEVKPATVDAKDRRAPPKVDDPTNLEEGDLASEETRLVDAFFGDYGAIKLEEGQVF